MKKLASLIIIFLAFFAIGYSGSKLYQAYEKSQLDSNYSIEQCYFSGSFMTYVWYNGGYKNEIVQSYTIETDSLTPESKIKDSLKAVRLIKKLEKLNP